jgi:hypothetical protein
LFPGLDIEGRSKQERSTTQQRYWPLSYVEPRYPETKDMSGKRSA